MTDEEIEDLNRGGHDPLKVFNAYNSAYECKDKPTVILAFTIKGYGIGSRQADNTPAITATIAIMTLTKKEITMMSTPEKLPCPPNAMPSICVSRNR